MDQRLNAVVKLVLGWRWFYVLVAGGPLVASAVFIVAARTSGLLPLPASTGLAVTLFALLLAITGVVAAAVTRWALENRFDASSAWLTELAQPLVGKAPERVPIRAEGELAAAARSLRELAERLQPVDEALRAQITGRAQTLGAALGELELLRKLNDSIIHNVPLGLAVLEQHGRLLFINQEFSRVWGIDSRSLGEELRLAGAGGPLAQINWEAELSVHQLTGQRRERVVETHVGGLRRVVRYSLHELPHSDFRTPLELVGEQFCVDFLATPDCDHDCTDCYAYSSTWIGRQWLLLIDDITEQRTLEAQLIQSEKLAALGQLSAGIAHEIRNPLSAIYSAAFYIGDVLADGNPDLEDVQEYVQLIRRNVERAQRIVRDILDFSRPSGDRVECVDLTSLVQTTARILDKAMVDQRIELDLQLEPETWVDCRAETVKQALLNLIVNAMQAMPAGGRLTIRAQRVGEHNQLEVVDTGTGIVEEHLSQVFNPFFTTKPAGQGTGLGLSIARQAIERDRGRLEVESELGVGTTFRVVLPVAAAPPIAEAAGASD